jgi:uncharacterized membrane protein YcaP (DUF421 family)
MIFDSSYGIVRVVTVTVLAYVALVVVLRLGGKRTLSKLNAFDLVVTVALGSTLATIALSSDVALVEGVVAFVVLAAAQYLVAGASSRWSRARRMVKAEPVLVLDEGQLVHDALVRERLTPGEVHQAVRSTGTGALADVAAVVLETDGTLSVISADALGSASALVDVGGTGA